MTGKRRQNQLGSLLVLARVKPILSGPTPKQSATPILLAEKLALTEIFLVDIITPYSWHPLRHCERDPRSITSISKRREQCFARRAKRAISCMYYTRSHHSPVRKAASTGTARCRTPRTGSLPGRCTSCPHPNWSLRKLPSVAGDNTRRSFRQFPEKTTGSLSLYLSIQDTGVRCCCWASIVCNTQRKDSSSSVVFKGVNSSALLSCAGFVTI